MAPNQSPHVLIFPLPLQGPINCMLRFAEILCVERIKVTFLNTEHIQRRLFDSSNIRTYLRNKYGDSMIQFETIPDGLPKEHPRSIFEFSELMGSIEAVAAPVLQEMLLTSAAYGPHSGNPVTCIVADGLLSFATHIAARVGVPLLYFDTISPTCLWTYMCLPKLIQAGELPFKDDNLDETIRNTPGMEGILRRRDLPSFCRDIDFKDLQVDLVLREIDNIPLSHGLILNTFQQLDAPILSQMLKLCPNIYALGPLHTHLQARLALAAAETSHHHPIINSSSIWQEDRSCISWLDKQPPNSVLYFSIGSLSVMTKDQFFEILYGVVNSGSRFLWVRRPGSVAGLDDDDDDDGIPAELLRSMRGRGRVVSWAPQREVLAHLAVGGFFTHGGWNSTLESVAAGKPMICWPHYVDQHVNSRYVGEVWKVGLDMKDCCDRVMVEKMVREVMEVRKDEFLKRGREMSEAAAASISQGGSSSADLDRLIQDIKNVKLLPMKHNSEVVISRSTMELEELDGKIVPSMGLYF